MLTCIDEVVVVERVEEVCGEHETHSIVEFRFLDQGEVGVLEVRPVDCRYSPASAQVTVSPREAGRRFKSVGVDVLTVVLRWVEAVSSVEQQLLSGNNAGEAAFTDLADHVARGGSEREWYAVFVAEDRSQLPAGGSRAQQAGVQKALTVPDWEVIHQGQRTDDRRIVLGEFHERLDVVGRESTLSAGRVLRRLRGLGCIRIHFGDGHGTEHIEAVAHVAFKARLERVIERIAMLLVQALFHTAVLWERQQRLRDR